ncbi:MULTISPECIES: hypothetical protein [unclassified Mesorhizobium]|uniref:hypothetical protein n=1 Tax=unclassified Mesorhizobium TaxID=325217 RepID=UPI000FCC93AD|nr:MULTISPECIES: hypothetical protein [unclassified Mesorhizobium]RUY28883.1 hypothetical protein EN979_11880 [Mesorhizobium sp. M7A.F.Ca.US.001.04.2.1]RUY42426.1 hypothetical protein EN978_12245 [Mesorhizobium sp. M7A.F.Ca.US.001.04.1.1]RVA06759.1 hypothetical protein EN938_05090 [Mesorhizobium sp. M7A.F.Ca.US.001.02.1.1]RVA15323.1 hypothetical protein EN932_01620 [Mesorhizobium sp. M7A.F.Ca.US.002.01.1.1]
MYWRSMVSSGALLLFSACASDYLNNYDSATLAAGDANHANVLLQTVDPFNPNSNNTHIESDGQRIAGVVQRYRGTTLAPPASGGTVVNVGDSGQHPCDRRTQTDSAGKPCGERAAEAKPDGRTGHETD